MIWNALPPLNEHLQVHSQVTQFRTPPASANVDRWQTRAFVGLNSYAWGKQAFAPLDFVNTRSGEVFPAEKIIAGEPWPGKYGDDGTGIFFARSDFPKLPSDIYYCPRAELLGQRYLVFVGTLADHEGYSKQATAYFQKGDPNDGHDAALALVRLAYDWPALQMTFHEIRLSTHCPDFEYETDWTGMRRDGKFYYRGWSGFFTRFLFEAYDKLFPYINDNQLFADEVHRFIPWIHTPRDVVRLLDRYLVFSSVRNARRGPDRQGQRRGGSRRPVARAPSANLGVLRPHADADDAPSPFRPVPGALRHGPDPRRDALHRLILLLRARRGARYARSGRDHGGGQEKGPDPQVGPFQRGEVPQSPRRRPISSSTCLWLAGSP